MIRKIATAAAVAGIALTYAASAYAGPAGEEMVFPATPNNAGAPMNLPGEGVIPGMRESMMIVNGVTQPILQPMLAPNMAPPGPAMAAAAPMPMHHHHHHHMYMKHKMMMHKSM